MAIQILHNYETGKGLEYAEGTVNVKPDNTGNVQFEVSEAGLKGNVQLPAQFDPSTLQQQIQELVTAKQELERKVQALETREDIHVTNAEVVEDTKLKITIQGANPVTVDLAKFLNVVPTSQQVYADVKDKILTDVKADLKGEEIQDFAGTVKGYLINV